MTSRALAEAVQKNGDKPLAVEYLREGVRHTIEVTPEKRKTIRLNLTRRREPFLGSTIVRPGALQYNFPLVWSEASPRLDAYKAALQKAAPAPDASAKRLDEMAAEIKELRKAIDGLRKALEDRK